MTEFCNPAVIHALERLTPEERSHVLSAFEIFTDSLKYVLSLYENKGDNNAQTK